MAKILFIEGDNIRALEETELAEESKLQDYLKDYPALIPLDDVVEGASELICIGKEVTVPSGAMDLLFIDKDGLLTVVETKLVKNPGYRREVIGQILEYASYISQWSVDKVYELANSVAQGDFDNFMLNKYPDSFSQDDLRNSIEQNLKDGKIRLIIAVDKLIEPLRRLVTFLNYHSDLKILLLEVSSYEGKGKEKVLAPHIFGYVTKIQKQGSGRTVWNEKDYFADVKEKSLEPDIVDVITNLYEFTKNNANMSWGAGATFGSFTFQKFLQGVATSIFTVQTDGRLSFSFGGMKTKVDAQILNTFRLKLNEISTIKIPEQVITQGKYPYIKLTALARPENLKRFKEAVISFCQQLDGKGVRP
jgi:hypothetical protein